MKKEDNKQPETTSGLNLWMLATIVVGIAFIGLLFVYLTSPQTTQDGQVVPSEICGKRIIDYLNTKVQAGTKANLLSTIDKKGLYEINVSYQGTSYSFFSSRDCSLLFSDYVDITAPTPTPTPTPTMVKSEKPTVDLYVMAFCPYGVQAENAMKPVVTHLGEKADIKVRYIVTSIQGDDLANVRSMHGPIEAEEDVRQLCIMQNYPSKFWDYLMTINEKCYKINPNVTVFNECWSTTAEGLGINITDITSCVEDGEGVALLKGDQTLAKKSSATASPTLIINGIPYSGARTPESYKQAICNAFVTAPSECSVTLNTTTTSTPAPGSCG